MKKVAAKKKELKIDQKSIKRKIIIIKREKKIK